MRLNYVFWQYAGGMQDMRTLMTICEWCVEMYDIDGFIQGHSLTQLPRCIGCCCTTQ